MSTKLIDVLSVSRKIRGNDRDSGTHYLLGYLWACIPEDEKEKIAKTFNDDLEKQEKNR